MTLPSQSAGRTPEFRKEHSPLEWSKVEKLALENVCPNTLKPSTVYETNAVQALTRFGVHVLKECGEDGWLRPMIRAQAERDTLKAENSALKGQRDELVAALEVLINTCNPMQGKGVCIMDDDFPLPGCRSLLSKLKEAGS